VVRIRAVFSEAVSAGTQAYAAFISDKLLTFQSDGSKMSETILKLQGTTALRHVSVAVKYQNRFDGSISCELQNRQLLTVL